MRRLLIRQWEMKPSKSPRHIPWRTTAGSRSRSRRYDHDAPLVVDPTDTVAISSGVSSIVEYSTEDVFTISRTGDLSQGFTVYITASGSGVAPVSNVTGGSNLVSFGASQAAAEVTVWANQEEFGPANDELTLSLDPDPTSSYYVVGADSEASVTLVAETVQAA